MSGFPTRRVAFLGGLAALAAGTMMLADHHHWTGVAAAPGFSGFTPGNLVVSRSVYQGDASTVSVNAPLPGGGTAVANGTYPGVWLNEGPDASFGVTSPIFLDELTPNGVLQHSLPIPAPSSGTTPDGLVTSFPSKSELGLHLSPDGSRLTFMGYIAPINALDVSNSNTPGHVDATNLVSLVYQRAIGEVDPSGHLVVTPANAYSGNNGRAAILANGQYYMVGNAGNGGFSIPGTIRTTTGSTTVILAGGATTAKLAVGDLITGTGIPANATVASIVDATTITISASATATGTATNGKIVQDGGTLSLLSDNTGVQMIARGAAGDTTVVGQVNGTRGNATGYQRGFSVALVNPSTGTPFGAADKTGKDDNFRGSTIFHDTLYVTKGSGGNGINTVYQVETPGTLPTPNAAGTAPITVLPGFPTTLATNLLSVDSTSTQVVNGQLVNKSVDPTTEFYPFGIWFANATTLYVADEGAPITTTGSKAVPLAAAALDQKAGLQKWSLVNGTWKLDYTLQNGLRLGAAYAVSNPDNTVQQTVAPAGLRHVTGRVNADGTVTLWATTSTTSTATDQGADPNQLVTITDRLDYVDAGAAASESFALLRTAAFGEVLRGVSLVPATIAPAWTTSVTPAPNAFGWNNTNVNVSLAASLFDGASQLIQSVWYTLTTNGVAGVPQHGSVPTEADFTVSAEGQTSVSYLAQDADSSSAPRMLPLIKIDKTAPTVTCAATPSVLWPPNNKLVAITVSVNVTDALSGPQGFVLQSVSSDEPDSGSGDIQGFAAGSPSTAGSLRASRLGTGTGRTYTLTYSGTDRAGNAASCVTTVVVPHDRGQDR